MNIWEDTKVTEIIEQLSQQRRTGKVILKESPKFVFVCGESILDESGNLKSKEEIENNIRYFLIDELEKKKVINKYESKNQIVKCVISEFLYLQDWAEDILSFEEILAEISEYIIIIVESPGTYCELGAFTVNESCLKKLVVINEDAKEYEKSFITRGPIRKLELYDENRLVLYGSKKSVFSSAMIQDKIDEIAKGKLSININDDPGHLHMKDLMYELCNIIEFFQPVDVYEVESLYKQICGFEVYTLAKEKELKMHSIKNVIKLLEQMEILCKEEGFYSVNPIFTFFNVLFDVDRKKFNDLRLKYLSRVYSKAPERM